jgi:hypothetical protein
VALLAVPEPASAVVLQRDGTLLVAGEAGADTMVLFYVPRGRSPSD